MALWYVRLAPNASVISGASLPFVILAFLALKGVKGPLDPGCFEFRRQAARLHLAFGLLYSLSFLTI